MIIVIPARGGSKRIPRKNIQELRGKPLLVYTLEAIRASGLNVPTYVSTDCKTIAELVGSFPGVEVVDRPPSLAEDNSSTESVLLHVLGVLDKDYSSPEWIMTLPPTSPLRTGDTIKRFFEEAMNNSDGVDCLMSVTEHRGDFWCGIGDGAIVRLFPDAPRRQQDRVPLLEENSAIYVTRASALRESGCILGSSVRGIVIPDLEAVDINSPLDLLVAGCLLDHVYCENGKSDR